MPRAFILTLSKDVLRSGLANADQAEWCLFIFTEPACSEEREILVSFDFFQNSLEGNDGERMEREEISPLHLSFSSSSFFFRVLLVFNLRRVRFPLTKTLYILYFPFLRSRSVGQSHRCAEAPPCPFPAPSNTHPHLLLWVGFHPPSSPA